MVQSYGGAAPGCRVLYTECGAWLEWPRRGAGRVQARWARAGLEPPRQGRQAPSFPAPSAKPSCRPAPGPPAAQRQAFTPPPSCPPECAPGTHDLANRPRRWHTLIALDLARRIIHDHPLPDGAPVPCPGSNVLIVDAEGAPALLNQRAQGSTASEGSAPSAEGHTPGQWHTGTVKGPPRRRSPEGSRRRSTPDGSEIGSTGTRPGQFLCSCSVLTAYQSLPPLRRRFQKVAYHIAGEGTLATWGVLRSAWCGISVRDLGVILAVLLSP